jgi:hypothetical protein
MADKEDISLYMAAGTKIFNQQKRSFEKLEKQNSALYNDLDNVEQDVDIIKQKFQQLTTLKKASEKQGNVLSSEVIKGLMDSIGKNVIDETEKVQMAIQKTFAPLDVELKQTIDLLTSPNEDAQDAALDRIDDIRKAMGVDFDKVAAAMGANVKELIASRQFMRENRRKEDELKESTKQQMLEKRDQLREQGINTYLDEKTQTLRVKTIRDEKEFKKSIIADEKILEQKRRETNELEKELRRKKTLDRDEENLIIANRQKLVDLEKDLNKKKEEANIKPEVKVSGFFAQTFGQAGNIIKTTFQEIGQMGRSLMKGFKNLPDTIGNFAKGLGRAALGIAVFAIKAILVVAAIVLFIMAIKRIVSAIKKAANKVLNFFGLGDDEKDDDIEGKDNKSAIMGGLGPSVGESEDINSVAQTPDQRASQDQKTSQAISNTTNYNTTGEENRITNEGDRITPAPRGPARIQPVPARRENVNRMSADMASSAGKGVNQVIAPTSVNNVTSNNTTQSMSRSPENADRSFINLNTVPV